MIRNCITCGQKTILGRYIDNALLVMNGEPSAGGEALLRGDLDDTPTAYFGIETAARFPTRGLHACR